MATEQNNTRINTFTDGMNTDVAYDSMKNSQYIYAINLRPYTTSKINGPQDIAAYGKYGVLTPVYHTDNITFNDVYTEYKGFADIKPSTISKIITSGDINILIYIYKRLIYLYKISIPDEREISTAYKYNREFLCFIDTGIGDLKNISAVLQYETNRVTNLYLADGKHKIMIINVVDTDYIKSLRDADGKINIDYISQNNYFPKKAVKYRAITSGQLKTSQVQYTYRFYKKYGVTSKLAPLSRKFQVINPSRNTEIGCSEDSITSIGLQLQIDVNENISQFDRIQVYRIQYVKPNQNADIDLIYDGGFEINKGQKEWSIQIIDNGKKTLQTLTMQEFSQIHGQDIIPKLLEQNQGYLFAGNIKDTTIFQLSRDDLKKFWAFQFTKDVENGSHKCYCFVDENLTEDQSVSDPNSIPGEQTYIGTISWLMNAFNNPENPKAYNTDYVNPYSDINHTRYDNYTDSMYDYYGYIGGSGDCISWRLVATELEDGQNNQNASYYFKITSGKPVATSKYIYTIGDKTYEKDANDANTILTYNGFPTANPTHDDAVTSSCIKSLKRGEVYRYGIILYKEDGTRSDAIWIGDIRIPGPDVIPLTNGENGTYQIGIEFVEEADFFSFAETNHICGYEIVRCQRTNEYSRSLQQVVISSTVRQKMFDGSYSPYYPTGFIISNPQYIGYTPYDVTISNSMPHPMSNQWPEVNGNQMTSGTSDNRLYQIYCPEIQTYVDDTLNKLRVNQISLTPALYLYSSKIDNTTNTDIVRFTTDNAYDKSTYTQIKYSNYAQKYHVFSLSFVPLKGLLPTYENAIVDKHNYTFGKYTNINYKILSYSKEDKSNKVNKLKYLESANVLYSRRFFIRNETGSYSESLEPRVYNGGKVDINSVYYTRETDFNLNQYNYYKPILNISSVRMLNWEDGFSNHIINGGKIENAVKKYKSYVKNISTSNYLNWVCGNKYNIPVGTSEEYGWSGPTWEDVVEFTNNSNADAHKTRTYPSIGPIGPAARCLIIQLSNDKQSLDELMEGSSYNKDTGDVWSYIKLNNIFGEVLTTNLIKNQNQETHGNTLIASHDEPSSSTYYQDPEIVSKLNSYPGTLLCEITHPAIHYSGKDRFSKQYDTYYGFGDYKEIKDDENAPKSIYVFTGDTYTQIYEIEGMYKAYDFNDDKSSLQSMQTVHYIPMESTINQYFDYGMNYRNTSNANLQSEAGEIKGVSTQDRPVHQYNLIYSDNGTSNDIYSPQSVIQSQNTYSQRICYSQMKTNGELLNNWNIFKPVDYIDVNPVYGELTDIFTVQDTLYFWQNKGFGKLSVNERSLVKDENSNLIQLGQGSVLQRYDYLSTKFGMRDQDMCKINVDNDIYWFDHRNRCIAAYKAVNAGNGRASMQVIDFTEKTNVKTLMKNCDITNTPTIEYDPNNDELLFNNVTLNNTGEDTDGSYTLAFNCKFDIAQSLYDINGCVNTIYNNKTNQDDIIYINTNAEGEICNSQLSNTKNKTSRYYLKFIVNPNASVTKVFDNQQIVYPHMYYNTYGNTSSRFDNAINFSTDLSKANTLNTNEKNSYTDREGNVCFSIPRCLNNNIQRLRGKWMIESIMNNDPESYSSISHIITKFRQSYN